MCINYLVCSVYKLPLACFVLSTICVHNSAEAKANKAPHLYFSFYKISHFSLFTLNRNVYVRIIYCKTEQLLLSINFFLPFHVYLQSRNK